MTKKQSVTVEYSYRPNPRYSFTLLKEFPELLGWLKSISRYQKVKDFVYISDYKKGHIHLRIFTKDHSYNISAKLPSNDDMTCKSCGSIKTEKLETGVTEERHIGCLKCGKSNKSKWGYLGCITKTRKPRAGEDWNRGNDLPDGAYCVETFREITRSMLAYELVKTVRISKDK